MAAKTSPVRITLIALALIAVAAGAVYWFTMRAPKAPPAAAAPPPAEVGVVTLASADVPLPLLYAGRVIGFRIVEIRSQVGGFLQKREFTDGEAVKAGDVLFRIDPRSFEAALARAKAQMAQAQATVTQAAENFTRVEGLAARQVSTQKALEDATAAREQSAAALASAKADVQTAELNLEYTVIRAPIAGRTSIEASPPEGTLVQPQQTMLTRITQLDPAYVYFTTTDSELRELTEINQQARQAAEGRGRHGRSCVSATATSIRTTARSTSAPASSIRAPARCRSARSSPTPITACCPASSCGSRSSASPCRTPSLVPKAAIVQGRRARPSTCSTPTTWRRPVPSSSTARSRGLDRARAA